MKSHKELEERIKKEKTKVEYRKKLISKHLEGLSFVFGPLRKKVMWAFEKNVTKYAILPLNDLELMLKHIDDPEGISNEDCDSQIEYFWKMKKEKINSINIFHRNKETGEYSLDFLGDSKSSIKKFLKNNSLSRKAIIKLLKKSETNPTVWANVQALKLEMEMVFNDIIENYEWFKS